MGVLDIPSHRLLIRQAISHHEVHDEDFDSDENNQQHAIQNERPRRQRTPKLRKKHYGHHDVKQGNGVRRKRRNDNFYFLCSLLDGLDPDEIPDENDFSMTAFGELFVDPAKMKVWADFISMAEEDQENFLHSTQKVKPVPNKMETVETRIDNPDFERIEQNIRHFLRSEQLSKDALANYEDDLVFAFNECVFDSLVLNIPSSFERMVVHGLCQYMQLQAQTHKVKKKRLMEIENISQGFSSPTQLLSEYLETFDK